MLLYLTVKIPPDSVMVTFSGDAIEPVSAGNCVTVVTILLLPSVILVCKSHPLVRCSWILVSSTPSAAAISSSVAVRLLTSRVRPLTVMTMQLSVSLEADIDVVISSLSLKDMDILSDVNVLVITPFSSAL